MRYTAKKIRYAQYELENELGQPSGSIKFNTWSMSKAKATIAQQEYDFYPVGFWQTKKVMTRDGIIVAELGHKLGKGFDISFPNRGKLYFRKKSFWTGSEYIIVDENNTTVATMTMSYNWKRWTYNYNIEIQDRLFDTEMNSLLPMVIFYTAVIMLRMRQAAAST